MAPAEPAALNCALLYLSLGMVLTPLRQKSKHATQVPRELVDEPDRARALWSDGARGMGVVHGPSATIALDIDSLPAATLALRSVGLTLDKLLHAGSAWTSGRPRSTKRLFRIPRGTTTVTRKLFWPPHGEHSRRTVFEIRAGDDWDVLPPSDYLDTGARYRWCTRRPSTWADIPAAPAELIELIELWPVASSIMTNACPWGVGWSAP